MKPEVRKFIKNNQLKINFLNSKKKILIADRALPEHVVLHSLAGYIFNKYLKYDVEVLTNLTAKNDLIKIYNGFNIKKINSLQLKVSIFNLFLIIRSLLTFFITILKIKLFGELWFIKKFSLKGVYLGDLTYDQYVRKDFSFLNKSFLELKFFKLLLIAIYEFYYIDALINKDTYEAVISGTHTYVSVSAIAMRVALKKKIRVINLISNNLRIFKNYKDSLKSNIHIYKSTIDEISNDKNWKKKFDIYLDNRLKGKILYPTAKHAYLKKKDYTKIQLMNILNKKKSKYSRLGLFAPHSFSDTNHGMGKIIFKDYYTHFIETLKIINKDKKTLWMVKPHPASHYFKEEGLVENELKKLNYENVFLCPEDITPKSAIIAADIFVTGRGSIGLESACFGRKAILAGESFYSDLGLTYNPKNIKEYEKLIMKTFDNKLTKSGIILAEKAFYSQAFKNSSITSKIFPIQNYININLSSKTIKQEKSGKKSAVDDYLFNLNSRLKNNSIFEDMMFKNFKFKILNEFKNKN